MPAMIVQPYVRFRVEYTHYVGSMGIMLHVWNNIASHKDRFKPRVPLIVGLDWGSTRDDEVASYSTLLRL
jgi:hypothetical protein